MLKLKKQKVSPGDSLQSQDFAFSSSKFLFFSFHSSNASTQTRLKIWSTNLRELVDAVEVGKGLGDTLAHGLLALTDPDTGVVEPD